MPEDHGGRSGTVAVIGRPNVGKSTLVNALVGQKLCITSPKPQTTRHRLVGIRTRPGCQAVYVDTPGLHRGGGRALNRYLNRTAQGALVGVDVVLLVLEALAWTAEDEAAADAGARTGLPLVVAVNKVDLVADKTRLLPYIERVVARVEAAHVFPLSARRRDRVDALAGLVCELLPRAPARYPEDQVTDRSVRFLAAEVVREKLTRQLARELPYRLSVEIERFVEKGGGAHVAAVIWVERDSQKAIVIGHHGRVLKAVGSAARRDLEHMLEQHVFLELWVKVMEDWSDKEGALRRLGYAD